jgi:hypothetical protein
MVSLPAVLGVKVTLHCAEAPVPVIVQLVGLKVPVTPVTDHETVPVGVVGVANVSVTVAVHVLACPTATVEGVQLTVTLTPWTAPVKVTVVVPLLIA